MPKSTAKRLLIVESPTKAKTIQSILGSGFHVQSSFGHIRDLPKSKMGVDTEHDFAPHYVISTDKRERVTALKALAKGAEVFLATDDDREGEAISWHLAHALGLPVETTPRVVFHEITKSAIEEAMAHPRHIRLPLVDAQQARRILDRLVGYELSPLLWKKVARGLSAGRVQSVAVRFVVERERERQAFQSIQYWSLDTTLQSASTPFPATVTHIAGVKKEKMDIRSHEEAQALKEEVLAGGECTVDSINTKQSKRFPKPPYTTSTLQQDANSRLGMTAKQTMRTAQELYEGVSLGSGGPVGLITYMRTDSLSLAASFVEAARTHARATLGDTFVPSAPRFYKTKSKGAQEAHEAIRPTDVSRTPESIHAFLSPGAYKLYDLIWRRAVASQLSDALVDRQTIELHNAKAQFAAHGSRIAFAGYLALFPERAEDSILPTMNTGDRIPLVGIELTEHATEPPARYSDATLVKAMEEQGIGRPSTYAPTIATIIDRNYVERDEQKRLAPTAIAFAVTDLLVEHFPTIVDKTFTAHMEARFDQVAEGEESWQQLLGDFYTPFHATITEKQETLGRSAMPEEKTDEVCATCGKPMAVKWSRFGKFLACSAYPECKYTLRIGKDGTVQKPVPPRELGIDPQTNSTVTVQSGRFGPYVQCAVAGEAKPKRASLLAGMTPETVTLEQALGLLAFPRTLHGDGEPILVRQGRFGPYVSQGKESRSLPKDAPYTALTITLEQAQTLLATPKPPRGNRRPRKASAKEA